VASDKVSRVIALHGKLARRVKEYEQTLGEFPPIVVLNEMRYAFRAFVEHWTICHDEPVDEDKLDHAEERAYHALVCAYHDLVDGLVIDLGSAMHRLTKEAPEATLEVLGGKRLEILDILNDVNEQIAQSREETRHRNSIYEQELYDRWFEQLLEYRKQLNRTITPEVFTRQSAIEQARLQERRRYLLTLLLAIAGILIGLGTFVF